MDINLNYLKWHVLPVLKNFLFFLWTPEPGVYPVLSSLESLPGVQPVLSSLVLLPGVQLDVPSVFVDGVPMIIQIF